MRSRQMQTTWNDCGRGRKECSPNKIFHEGIAGALPRQSQEKAGWTSWTSICLRLRILEPSAPTSDHVSINVYIYVNSYIYMYIFIYLCICRCICRCICIYNIHICACMFWVSAGPGAGCLDRGFRGPRLGRGQPIPPVTITIMTRYGGGGGGGRASR